MALNPKFTFGALELTQSPFAVEFGSDRGSPEQVVAEVTAALTDGSLTKVVRYANRTVTIPVLIEGANLTALAQAEALLVAEARKARNEFAFNPGDGAAPTSVYQTFEADLTPISSDDGEQNLIRRYVLEFQALPFARSSTKTITAATVTVAPTVVDAGSATTNWTATLAVSAAGATVSTLSGAVISTYNPATVDAGFYGTRLRRAFPTALDVSVNKYLAVDWKTSVSAAYALIIGFVNQPEARRELAPTAGYTRSWFKLPNTMTAVSAFEFAIQHPANTGSATLSIDQVLIANTLPSQGTGRQKAAVIYPGGSEDAEGDIIIDHPTSALSRTIVYTHPIYSGYSPPLRPWRTSGGSLTANSALVSGQNELMVGAPASIVYSIPVNTLPPGAAHLWFKMGATSTSAVRLNWSATAWQGGVAQTNSRQTGNLLVQVPAVGPHYLFPIARMTLPPAQVTGPNGYVVIIIDKDASSSSIDVSVDEAWIFAMDKGTLSVVDCGDGTVTSGLNANKLRISAPSVDAPYGDLRVATTPDWSDAWEPAASNILCDQRGHRFSPDGSMIFTVTSLALDASVSLEHYRRWHTHAGS